MKFPNRMALYILFCGAMLFLARLMGRTNQQEFLAAVCAYWLAILLAEMLKEGP
jgi:hypothetical protein